MLLLIWSFKTIAPSGATIIFFFICSNTVKLISIIELTIVCRRFNRGCWPVLFPLYEKSLLLNWILFRLFPSESNIQLHFKVYQKKIAKWNSAMKRTLSKISFTFQLPFGLLIGLFYYFIANEQYFLSLTSFNLIV